MFCPRTDSEPYIGRLVTASPPSARDELVDLDDNNGLACLRRPGNLKICSREETEEHPIDIVSMVYQETLFNRRVTVDA